MKRMMVFAVMDQENYFAEDVYKEKGKDCYLRCRNCVGGNVNRNVIENKKDALQDRLNLANMNYILRIELFDTALIIKDGWKNNCIIVTK